MVAAGAAGDPGGGQTNGPATEQMYNAGGHRRRAPAVAPGRRGAPGSKKSGPGAGHNPLRGSGAGFYPGDVMRDDGGMRSDAGDVMLSR